MSNVQHLSRSDRWFTPKYLVDMVHQVLGTIDLDPCSEPLANLNIKAKRILTENALDLQWCSIPSTLYLNPPGGKLGNKSNTVLFWQKLMEVRDAGLLEHAIFMGFSLEHLATTQQCNKAITNFPVVIPRKRIRFLSPEGRFNSPTHANVIAYVPGNENKTGKFKEVFGQIGAIMHPDMPAN